jgi:hypothetical protein
MLMKDNKKNSVALIMNRLNSKSPSVEEKPQEDGVEQDASIGLHTAAEELMQAIESKSAPRVAEAFKALSEMCGSDESPAEEQAESED